ncbi:putative fatty acyl-CoA reductase CG5065 [Battus philenor]|uniref:putative fatty acyl-CoA reductase CG5065 n=1 Tax=Battus philenor TaxID=42288 RepID=UPI0035D0F250
MELSEAVQNVPDFYAGKTVFITGGTGFLGKILIEKFLYSCTKLEKIYVLIRENREGSHCRIKNMLNLPIFKRLRERGEDFNKIVPITGDIMKDNLGIAEKDLEQVIEKTAIVVHLAATVRFNEPLKLAMEVNFEGTRRILNLCSRMKSLERLVYVSTAYAHTNRDIIEEVIYPPPASYEDVYAEIKKYGDNMKQVMENIINRPNTYAFTKSLTENYVAKNHPNVPVIVIRPSVVTATKNEPFEGWIDNWFGATGMLTAVGMGYIRVLFGKASNIVDLIPVDYVTNLIIAAAAKCDRCDTISVFNSCSSGSNPVTMEYLNKKFIEEIVRFKLNAVPYPTITFTENPYILRTIIFIAHIVPAYILDCFLRLIGKEPRFMKKQERIVRLEKHLRYFTEHSWIFRSKQAESLFASLSRKDQDTFPFDPRSIEWSQYVPVFVGGVRTHLI